VVGWPGGLYRPQRPRLRRIVNTRRGGGEAEYVLYALALLKEQTFLGVTESEHTGGGHGEGSYRVYRLLRSPQIVSEGLDEV